MADLTTLDPTAPADSEVVSQGAARMREERADILGWAALEHAFTGPHKFKQGDGTYPGLPGVPAPGNVGRIFIDTTNSRVLRDTGSTWQILNAVQFYSATRSDTTGITTGTPVFYEVVSVNYIPGCTVLAFATAALYNLSGPSTVYSWIKRQDISHNFTIPPMPINTQVGPNGINSSVWAVDIGAPSGTNSVSLWMQSVNAGTNANGITLIVMVF